MRDIVALRQELAARAPEADDSVTPRPQTPGVPPMAWAFTLANFDQIATDGPDRIVHADGWDRSRSRALLGILEHKLRSLQRV